MRERFSDPIADKSTLDANVLYRGRGEHDPVLLQDGTQCSCASFACLTVVLSVPSITITGSNKLLSRTL